MKTINIHTRQRGFFDLGLAFVILTISGTTAYVSIDDQDEEIASNMHNNLVEKTHDGARLIDDKLK